MAETRRRVFIVEDDELLRGLLGRGLRRLGYDICGEASSGEAALEQIPALRPDLIVMDVGLSTAITGVDVAEQLRGVVDIPIVFVTGSTDAAVAKLAGETGSFGYVVKPVNAEILAANLEMAAGRHAAEAHLRRTREELERVNTRLRESEERYRSLFEEAIEGVFRMSLDGAIVAANPAFARIVGFETPDALLGMSAHSFAASPEDAQRLRALAAQGGAIDGVELVWRTRNGSTVAVELYGRVLHDAFFQGFVRDVTEVRERTRAERVALEANRAKTHFLASMSHELRTPLNAVLGLSDALLARTYGALTAGQERGLQTINASGRHLLDLINDVLDVARIEAGRFPIDVQDVALHAIAGECIAFVIEQAEARRQRLTLALDPTIGVRADARRLKQVLINLLANAIKFTPDGGAITVRVGPIDNGLVELSVSDNGPGIAEGDRTRVFEPFVTLDPSSRSGAGLGLALVKRIVELQGGSVRVEDEPAGGARFIVTLREGAIREDVEPPRVATNREHDRKRPRTGPAPLVLLVEDNEANVFAMSGSLEARGYRVRVVRDGLSAVGAATDPNVSIVLMDVQLPVMSGLDAIRAIRRDERRPHVPIVALTAHAMTGDEEQCLAAGATAYLSKPVDLKRLVHVIEELSNASGRN